MLPGRQPLLAYLFPFHLRRRHPHANVIANKIIAHGAAFVVTTVGADAVEQITLAFQPIHQRLPREEIIGNGRQVTRREVVQLGGVAAMIAVIGRQGEGDVQIALRLLQFVVSVLHVLS